MVVTFYYKCRLLVNHMVLVLFNVKNPKMPSRLSKKVNNFAAETKEKAVLPPTLAHREDAESLTASLISMVVVA